MNDGPDGKRDPSEDVNDEHPAPDEEWQFTLEDIEARETKAEEAAEAQRRRNEPIEPGSPSLENTAFVLLGVVLTLFVLSRLLVG